MPIHGVPFADKQLFELINVVLPGWAVLAIAPWWRHSQTISAASALVMAALYSALTISSIVYPPADGAIELADMFTYEGVVRLLSTKNAVLPAWVHYAAFDLWVGRWAAADSVKRGVPQLLLIPCLAAIMFLGPLGLLSYMLFRIPFNKAPAAGKKKKTA